MYLLKGVAICVYLREGEKESRGSSEGVTGEEIDLWFPYFHIFINLFSHIIVPLKYKIAEETN